MLDAILGPERFSRYFFDAHWGEGEAVGSMTNGSGDEWFIVFSAAGAFGRGFDHEASEVTGVFDAVPNVFRDYVVEPAFGGPDMPGATMCFWRGPDESAWNVADPSTECGTLEELFPLLFDDTAAAYCEFAVDYFETELDPAVVGRILALEPLTASMVAALNPNLEFTRLAADLAEIGYPMVSRASR